MFDQNKDGHLNMEEFEQCVTQLFSTSFEGKVKLIFDLFDFDSDGKVSKEDIRTLLSHVPPVDIQEVTNVAKRKEIGSPKKHTGTLAY
jgi:Ca2+-binding EF-hand superfamily protein